MSPVPGTDVLAFLARATSATVGGAVVLFVFLWAATRLVPARRIDSPRPSDARRARGEIARSLATLVVVVAAIAVPAFVPAPLLRLDVPPPGTLVGEVVVFTLGYDFAYYWLHRLMHAGAVYRAVHRAHHLSRRPTLLAALSFHPLESAATMGLFVAVAILLRLHAFSLVACEALQLAATAVVHCGYAVLPAGWERTPGLGFTTTPLVHATHHRRHRSNFGFYTTLWDRLFGTFDATDVDAFWRARGAGAPDPSRRPLRRRGAAAASSS
ncbi:MAG TPA: sterol desaturase family protein [Candidatus Binatia bacterium]|jgi:sterol desaturase/sphingolipid hydroxylase (fatty acid hydroxylase superfamily)|nr:sterol desaturase family protein [Candidatus Binatia bacterium]